MARVATYGAPQVGTVQTTGARFRAADVGAAGRLLGKAFKGLVRSYPA